MPRTGSTRDSECIEFLQWALPQMQLRWRGFRRVRRQVCRRLNRRMSELGLANYADYASYVETHPAEWRTLDQACHITISRFYRDRAVFDDLLNIVLPELSVRATQRGDTEIVCWSAGCASGEEPYSLAMLWNGSPPLRILATDADPHMIARAKHGCYQRGSLKEVPVQVLAESFECQGDTYCVRPHIRERVEIRRQDLRQSLPEGPFDLILCRNLVLSYFDEELQRVILERFSGRLRGALVIGTHESMRIDSGYQPWPGTRCIFLPPGSRISS